MRVCKLDSLYVPLQKKEDGDEELKDANETVPRMFLTFKGTVTNSDTVEYVLSAQGLGTLERSLVPRPHPSRERGSGDLA